MNDSRRHTQKKALKAAPTHSDVPLSQFDDKSQLDFLIPTRATSFAELGK